MCIRDRPVGGDNIGVDSKFLHELVDTFTEKLSIGAVESDELQSTHCLCTGTPVSYTHLDVYKRQASITARAPR